MREPSFDSVEPVELTWQDRLGDTVMAVSRSDGHASTYSPGYLRKICPCAECKGTHTGKPKAFNILTASQVKGINKEIDIQSVDPVGNYAVAFTWGDGHREGIYSWSYLRSMSPEAKRAAKGSEDTSSAAT